MYWTFMTTNFTSFIIRIFIIYLFIWPITYLFIYFMYLLILLTIAVEIWNGISEIYMI